MRTRRHPHNAPHIRAVANEARDGQNGLTTASDHVVVMRFFGIKKPCGMIWWIADSEHNSWLAFFTYPSESGERNAHRLPLAEAIKAYQGIGYRCVELEVRELSA